MEKLTIQEEIAHLRRELERANRNYYIKNAPTITDYEYDLMMHRLQQLEEENPQFAAADSPTVRVGSDLFSSLEESEPVAASTTSTTGTAPGKRAGATASQGRSRRNSTQGLCAISAPLSYALARQHLRP